MSRLQRRLVDVSRTLRKNPNMATGFAILVVVATLAIFAQQIQRADPQKVDPFNRLQSPSAQYWFGTDGVGRDVYYSKCYVRRL